MYMYGKGMYLPKVFYTSWYPFFLSHYLMAADGYASAGPGRRMTSSSVSHLIQFDSAFIFLNCQIAWICS